MADLVHFSFSNRLQDISGIKAGDTLAWAQNDLTTSVYKVTVTKVTPKTVVFDCPDEESYKRRSGVTFRMRRPYAGAPEYLEPQGEGIYGHLHRIDTPEAQAEVEASYKARADAKAAQQAIREAREQERTARKLKEEREAMEANEGVRFQEFATLGVYRYFQGTVINKDGNPCMVVLQVRRMKDPYAWSRDDDAQADKQVWFAALNYSEYRTDRHDMTPTTMSSCSGDIKGDTLEQLFERVIARVW